MREWRQNNPDKVKEHKRRDYEKRKPQILAKQKEYVAKKRAAWTPEQRAAHLKKRHGDYLKRTEARRLKQLEKSKAKDEMFLAGFKECTLCKNEKPIDNFWSDKTKKYGLSSYCIDCSTVQAKQYRQDNLEVQKQREKIRRDKNKDKVNAQRRLQYRSDPQKFLKRNRESAARRKARREMQNQ